MGRIATSSLSPSFALVFITIMLSLFVPSALARNHHPSLSHLHDLLSAKQVRPWPCCDSCGACTKSIPPLCQCLDLHPLCPPACQLCIEEDQEPALSADLPRKYRCLDVIENFCKQTCTSASITSRKTLAPHTPPMFTP